MLPQSDADFLAERMPGHSVTHEGGMICVLIPDYKLPPGFDRKSAALLLRLSPGYPDVRPDMWWFDPAVRRADNAPIQATEVVEQYLGRQWQRWSRHLPDGVWRSGIDNLQSYLALLQKELRAVAAPVAGVPAR
ncbi:MAG: E2/UBC family protein [Pseudomonadota bacterium]